MRVLFFCADAINGFDDPNLKGSEADVLIVEPEAGKIKCRMFGIRDVCM